MSTTTETVPVQDRVTDTPRAITCYVIRHHDGGFAHYPLVEEIGNLVDDEDDRHSIAMYQSRDVACATRLQMGWSDEADIIPVTIAGRASDGGE